MTTVAQAAAHRHQDVGFVLFFEGWAVAWTDRVELAGSGGGSWVGTGDGARSVRLGLEVPDSVTLGVNSNSGMIAEVDATFTLLDHQSDLIALISEATPPSQIYGRLDPTQDPAPATLLGTGEDEVDLWGRYINGESIGAAGERRQFQVLPGGTLPGFDHTATSGEDQFLLPSEVSVTPRWYDGRRMSLYLIRRLPNGTWPSWSTQDASGYARIWWGTVRSARVKGRAWDIACDGPGSWLRAGLNRNRSAEWRSAIARLVIADAERRMACGFAYRSSTGTDYFCAYSLFDGGSDVIATEGDSVEAVRSNIAARLTVIAGTAGDETFTTYRNGKIQVQQNVDRIQFSIRVDDGAAKAGRCWVVLHDKVWRWLGWDPEAQQKPMAAIAGPYEVEFTKVVGAWKPWAAVVAVQPPTGGYWAAQFTTVPIGSSFTEGDNDNEGAKRLYLGLNPAGVMIIDPKGGLLPVGYTAPPTPYAGEQLARPVDDRSIGGDACDRTGFIALRGSYRESIDTEPVKIQQIFKASWVDDGEGTFGVYNSVRYAYLTTLLDPLPFGVPGVPAYGAKPGGKLTRPWAAVDLEWAVVAVFGYSLGSSGDRAELVLARLLLSTGTAAWTGTEDDDDAEETPGVNAHPDVLPGSVADDLEAADLSLGVPASMVDIRSFIKAAAGLPGGAEGALNRCRLVRLGNVPAQDLIAGLVEPRGWAFGFQGGRYSLWVRGLPLTAKESIIALTQADLASDDLPHVETVDLTPLSPIDVLTMEFGANPLGEADSKTLRGQARDAFAWRRHGGATKEIDGSGLTALGGAWEGQWRQRWEKEMAEWYATPHVLLTLPIKPDRARDIWPGVVITYASPWPATRDGSYGMTGQLGRVLSIERDLRTSLVVTARVLMQPGDPLQQRLFAPLAAVLTGTATLEERYDVAARRFYCHGNYWGRDDDDLSDVEGFAPPAWLAATGDALVYGYQHDGRTWSQTFECLVQDVDTSGHSLRYQDGSFSGKFWEVRPTLLMLAPWDDQDTDSWTRQIYGVITKPSGIFGGADTPGWKFK